MHHLSTIIVHLILLLTQVNNWLTILSINMPKTQTLSIL